MPPFYVNDRRTNRTLATGTYDDAGEVSWDATEGLTDDGREVVEAVVSKDVADGHSGGQVPGHPHVEWLTLLGRDASETSANATPTNETASN